MVADHVANYLTAIADTAWKLDREQIEGLIYGLVALRERQGRLFLLGVGGSAANCSHAANDFRKLCNIEAYCATDNIAELTARTNDDGWESIFAAWLHGCRLSSKDAIMIFSVGGGNEAKRVSVNIVSAIRFAKQRQASIYSIVGRSDGAAALQSDVAIIVPTMSVDLITPISESFQAVVWHCLVSHPALQRESTKW